MSWRVRCLDNRSALPSSWLQKYNLTNNPFGNVDDAKVMETLFVDRDDPLLTIVNIMESADGFEKVGLKGAPGVGKTALLDALMRSLRDLKTKMIMPIKIDLDEQPNSVDLLLLFISHLLKAAKEDPFKNQISKTTREMISNLYERLRYTITQSSENEMGMSSGTGGIISALLNFGLHVTHRGGKSRTSNPMRATDAQGEFERLLQQLKKDGILVVICLDEADKWHQTQSEALVRNVKTIVRGGILCHVVVVGNADAFTKEMTNYIKEEMVFPVLPFINPVTGAPSSELGNIITKRLNHYAIDKAIPSTPFDAAALETVFRVQKGVIKDILVSLQRTLAALGKTHDKSAISNNETRDYLEQTGVIERLDPTERKCVDIARRIGPQDFTSKQLSKELKKERGGLETVKAGEGESEEESGYSERWLRKILESLERKGWIVQISGSRKGGAGSQKHYKLL